MENNKNNKIIKLDNKELLRVVSEVVKWKSYSAGLVATIYYLHFERGWKASKIAKSLEISLSTVYSIISYIKAVEKRETQAEPMQTTSFVQTQLSSQTQPTLQEQQQVQRRTIIDILRGGKRG